MSLKDKQLARAAIESKIVANAAYHGDFTEVNVYDSLLRKYISLASVKRLTELGKDVLENPILTTLEIAINVASEGKSEEEVKEFKEKMLKELDKRVLAGITREEVVGLLFTEEEE